MDDGHNQGFAAEASSHPNLHMAHRLLIPREKHALLCQTIVCVLQYVLRNPHPGDMSAAHAKVPHAEAHMLISATGGGL